jgi:hypothetical protein
MLVTLPSAQVEAYLHKASNTWSKASTTLLQAFNPFFKAFASVLWASITLLWASSGLCHAQAACLSASIAHLCCRISLLIINRRRLENIFTTIIYRSASAKPVYAAKRDIAMFRKLSYASVLLS